MIQQLLQHYNHELILYRELKGYMLSFKNEYTQKSENFSDADLEIFKQGYEERLFELRNQESIRNKLIKDVSTQYKLQSFSIRNLESTGIESKIIMSLAETIDLLGLELQEITDLNNSIQDEISISLEKTKLAIYRLQSAKRLKNAYSIKTEKEPFYVDKNE